MTAISAGILQRAIELYLERAYPPGALPSATQDRIAPIRELPPAESVPESLLERDASASEAGFALRLGQPLYPHMKLIIEPAPTVCRDAPVEATILLRVDTHDRHLHATPGSPDAAWLASIRASNKQLTEQIEAAWSAAHLPTFKDFLRQQLDARKARRAEMPPSEFTI